ncbi:MAG TPA: hypothetical protein VF263_13640 [Longimicrobiaceae bacterium]
MQVSRLATFGLITAMFACADAERDTVVGKWKRSDNQEVLDFAEDGTVSRVATIRRMKGPDAHVTTGGTYTFPSEDKIQVAQELVGPITYSYQMFGDSMRWVGPDGRRVTYYRDNGEKPSVTYRLKTVDGHPLPYLAEHQLPISAARSILEKTEYHEGQLILDPLTHTFSLAQATARGSRLLGPRQTFRAYGTYLQRGDSLTLRYEAPSDAPPMAGSIYDSSLTLQTHVHNPLAPEGQKYLPGPTMAYVLE